MDAFDNFLQGTVTLFSDPINILIFLGGVVVYGGDPGPGIFASPVGGALLLVAVATTAWGISRDQRTAGDGR